MSVAIGVKAMAREQMRWFWAEAAPAAPADETGRRRSRAARRRRAWREQLEIWPALARARDERRGRYVPPPDSIRIGPEGRKSLHPGKVTRRERREWEHLVPGWDSERPKTRAECKDMPRPCPFVSCKHHLYLEVKEDCGSIKLNFPDKELEELEETCSLDVAERDADDPTGIAGLIALHNAAMATGERGQISGLQLERVGAYLGLTLERARQLQARAILEARRKLRIQELAVSNRQQEARARAEGRDIVPATALRRRAG